MGYLVNPKGRTVAIEDETAYKEWLSKPNFRPATQTEIDEYQNTRLQLLRDKERARNKEIMKSGVQFVTVTQGGKDGYATASRNIVSELKRREVPVSFHNEGQKIAILFHNPYSVKRLENPVRIIYTMFESTKIPDDWKEFLEVADKVLVPSKWCKDVFAKAGITTEVVPLGYDSRLFKYKAKKSKKENRKDFLFLHYNAFNLRKGFTEVFKAFTQEFDPTEPVKLVLKTTLEQIPLPITQKQYPNIKIIKGKLSDAEMVKLNQDADCFLFPSRGEGFGMTPLEAMACGTTAIVPNAHGITEYFDPKYMYEVKVKETCPAIYSRYKGQNVGQMFVSDIDDLRKKMRYAYEHEEETHRMGKEASDYVKAWTFEKTAGKLYDIIRDRLTSPTKDRPLHNVLEVEAV